MICVSQSDKWPFDEASAQFSANKSNLKKKERKINTFFFWSKHLFLQQSVMQRSCSPGTLSCPTEREIRNAQRRDIFFFLSHSLSLLANVNQIHFACLRSSHGSHTRAFASRSLIVRQSLELLWCWGSRGGYHRAKPRREMLSLMLQSWKSHKQAQERRCDLGCFCRAFKPSERQHQFILIKKGQKKLAFRAKTQTVCWGFNTREAELQPLHSCFEL